MPLSPIADANTAAVPIDGFGTILEYQTGTVTAGTVTWSGTWKQISNLVEIKTHENTSGKIKTTTHSTAAQKNTYRLGLQDSGSTELVCLYDKTALPIITGLYDAKTLCEFRATYKDTYTDTTQGYVESWKVVTPIEGDATIELKILHTGATTLAELTGGIRDTQRADSSSE